MISTYAELQLAVQKWLIRDSSDLVITSAQIQNFIQLAESEMNRALRIMELKESDTVTTTINQNYINQPDGFNGIESFIFDSCPYEIESRGSLSQLVREFGPQLGRPQGYALRGSRIIFNGPADAAYAMTLDYYIKIPALSDSNTTNVILENYPDAYLYGTLKQAQMQISDTEKLQTFVANFMSIIDQIVVADKKKQLQSMSKMQPRRVI